MARLRRLGGHQPNEARVIDLDKLDLTKAAFSLAELVALSGIHRNKLARMLESAGVEFARVGVDRHVPTIELEQKIPLVWEGIVRREERRRTRSEQRTQGT